MVINGRGVAFIGFDPVTSVVTVDSVLDTTAPLPALEVDGAGQLDASLPLCTLDIVGYEVTQGVIDLTAILPTFSLTIGDTIDVMLPLPTLSLAASHSIYSTLMLTAPLFSLSASAVTSIMGELVLAPTVSFSMFGGDTLSVSMPIAAFSAAATTGIVSNLTATASLPTLLLRSSVTESIAVLQASLPVLCPVYGDLQAAFSLPVLELSDTEQVHNLVAYAMNIKSSETTTYSNYAFDFIVRIGFDYYGVKPDGLYQLTGADDAGTPIAATFTTAETDFATSAHKRSPQVYIDSEDRTTIRPIVDGKIGNAHPSGYGGRRTTLARGYTGKIWQIKVSNVSGKPMKVGALEVLPEVLTRKI